MGLPRQGSSCREPRAGLGLLCFFPSEPTWTCLSPPHSRIGRKATILVQLLLLAVIGVTTAFMPSLELYMALRFAGATAVAGYAISNITLREYMGLQAFSHPVNSRGLATFPRLPVGPFSGTPPKSGHPCTS